MPQITLPPLKELVACTEALANLGRPTGSDRSVRAAVALNTAGLTPADAVSPWLVEQELNLPAGSIRWSETNSWMPSEGRN